MKLAWTDFLLRWGAAGFVVLALFNAADVQAEPTGERAYALNHLVRQDCGSCHGLRLTGGIGPALTPRALADRSRDSLVATILHGRPGTPMPPWSPFLNEDEAGWIVDQLQHGYPENLADAH